MNRENLEEHFWYRILKVLYILLFIPLPFVVWFVFLEIAEDWVCVGARLYRNCSYVWGTPADILIAVVAASVAFVIYVGALIALRAVALYIIAGKKQKPPTPQK